MTDRATFDANAAWINQYLPGKRYSPVHVEILDAKQNQISFLALDVNLTWSRYTATWEDTDVMWAAFPSTLPSGAQNPPSGGPPLVPGALPAKGAFGILYLAETFMNGTTPKIAPPKWPRPF